MKDLLVVAAVILAACAIPVVIGVAVSRRLKAKDPGSEVLRPIPSWAAFEAALYVLGLILLLVAREIYPGSSLGSLLQPVAGFLMAIVLWTFVASALGRILFRRRGT
ncbi:MAG: hypothetical protein ABL989_15915 [Gammaproteobacteria bacterium]